MKTVIKIYGFQQISTAMFVETHCKSIVHNYNSITLVVLFIPID